MQSRGGDTQVPATRPGGEPVTPSRQGPSQDPSASSLGQQSCKGCHWTGKSLRGHLVRTKSGCQDLYDMQDLEREALKVQDQQKAQWESNHRKERSEKRVQQRLTHGKESPKKRAASSSPSPASPRKQHDSATTKKIYPSTSGCHFCSICDKSFTRSDILHQHVEQVHKKEDRSCCKYCGATFSRFSTLERHYEVCKRSSSKPKEYKCDICKKDYSQYDDLDHHITEVHGIGARHQCNICDAVFTRKETLESHYGLCKSSSSKPKKFKCDLCDKQYSRQHDVDCHIKEVHCEVKFTCDICGDDYSTKSNLYRHIREVHSGPGEKYKCDYGFVNQKCQAYFNRKEHLDEHKKGGHRKHHIPYECDICYQTIKFKSRTARQTHLIKVKNLPSLTKCRDAERAKYIPKAEKSAFYTREHLRDVERKIWFEHDWPGRYDPDKDGTVEEYVKRLMEKEIKRMAGDPGLQKIVEERDQKIIWDAYSWDYSLIDPFTKLPISDPVLNKICGHIYERKAVEGEIEQRKVHGEQVACPGALDMDKCLKYETLWHPWSGCINKIIDIADLEPHQELKEEIEQRKAKRKEEIEVNPQRRGDLYTFAQRKRLAFGSDWNDTLDKYLP